MDKDKFLELIDGAGYSHMDYSGRGMYGEKCIGIDIDGDSVAKFVSAIWAEFIYQSEDLPTDDQADGLNEIFASAQTDSLGLGVVIYFSKLKVE